jgi:hypothetical protein
MTLASIADIKEPRLVHMRVDGFKSPKMADPTTKKGKADVKVERRVSKLLILFSLFEAVLLRPEEGVRLGEMDRLLMSNLSVDLVRVSGIETAKGFLVTGGRRVLVICLAT